MRKRPINIIGGFYRDPNLHWSRQDTLNWIPVRAEQEGTLTPFQLRDAPGVKPFVRITRTVPDGEGTAVIDVGPIRGMRNVEGKLFVVAAQTLYQISNTGVAIPFGTIPGVGRVSMAHNQFGLANQLIIVNGSAGYVFNTNTQVLVKITDEGYPGAFIADYIDQYLAQVEPQGRFWFHSDLANGTDYNTLDRYEAEADPDRIVSLIVSHREVLVFGRDTIEPFVNTGGQTGTFERASNTVIEVGCAAKFTPRKLDNSVFWLDDKRLVRRLDGYTPIRVSTDAIDAAFAECTATQVAAAYAFTWETRGHKVYYITVPGMFTFGYDVLTGQWHRRSTWNMAHWDAVDAVFWNGQWIIGSGQNGRLYILDQNYKLDRCAPLVRKRVTGKLWDAENEMTLNNVELKFNTGGPVSVCVPFPDQPLGPSISGEAPDATAGSPYSFSYTVTPGGAPIDRTVLLPGSYVFIEGVQTPLPAGGWNWNQATATVTGPGDMVTTVMLRMRVYDENGLFADHTDSFEITSVVNVLVVGNPLGVGQPMFASSLMTSAGAGTFTGIPTVSGANIEKSSCIYDPDASRWVAISEGGVRVGSLDLSTWTSGTEPSAISSYTNQLVNGPGGLAAFIDDFLVEDTPGNFIYSPPTAVTPGDQTYLDACHRIFSDGLYYYTSESYRLFRTTDVAAPWTTIFNGTSQAITRFSATQRDEDGNLWAVNMRGASANLGEVRWSPDNGTTWPSGNVVVSQNNTGSRPAQLAKVGVHLVAFCSDGNVWTSANNWSELVVTGLPAPGISGVYHVDINGFPHVADIGGNALVVSRSQFVTINLATLEVSALGSLPILNVSGVAARVVS